jgi:hypothetical protein
VQQRGRSQHTRSSLSGYGASVTRTVPIVFTQTPDPVAAVFGWKRVDQHRQHIGTMRLIVRKPKCRDDCIAERRL